jgi:tripartite-type tricarboxylate transporter receptor subunit TctC
MIVMGRRLALAFAMQCLAARAFAADYPARPIRLVVPYAPGGGADSVARIVAKRVSEQVGQPIVIDNKGGAGSILGTDVVAKAEPDD